MEGVAGVNVYGSRGDLPAAGQVYPEKLRIVLLKNGQELKSMALDVASAMADAEESGDYYLHFTSELHWKDIDAEKEELSLQVELTDNLGRVTTHPVLT